MLNAKLIISQIEDVRFAIDQLEFWQKDVEQNPQIEELKPILANAEQTYNSQLDLLFDYLNLPKDTVIDIDAIEDALISITKQDKLTDDMRSAWESDDECAQACNDPGLQYEAGENLESMWNDFYTKVLGVDPPKNF